MHEEWKGVEGMPEGKWGTRQKCGWKVGEEGVSGLMAERVLAAVKDGLKSLYPDPWSQPMTRGRELKLWCVPQTQVKNYSFAPYLFQSPLGFQLLCPSLSPWLSGCHNSDTPTPPLPLWSGPSPFCRSPELSTLSYFPALSSEIIIPRSMFL